MLHLLHQFIIFLPDRLRLYCIDVFSTFWLLTLVVKEEGGSAVPYQAPIQVLSDGLLRQATYTTTRLGTFRILRNKALEANDGKPLPLYQKSFCGLTAGAIGACSAAESRNPASQNVVILIFHRSVESGFQKGMDMASSSRAQVFSRLVISQNQMGCLLAKSGSIVADMRKMTGAFIKIVGDHQVPKRAPETDQVTGEMINVRDALYSVTGRLRNNLFSNKMSNTHETGTGTKRHNTNLTQAMDNLKLSSSSIDRHMTPRKWHLPMGQDISTGSTFVGRSATIVSNMSVEILNGSNLTRLRQISGAKVVVHEPRSGTSDHIVVISGTPNETQSAQSLLQAFILADQS
uniref:K Homology domain-containing protein n=1 Tax=Lactuca sativa TaxID=4236 RepID=A0A9R1V4P3_LACSA|nr:hypothetical protein LSAT_V11C600320740 [Lactuca sativa]